MPMKFRGFSPGKTLLQDLDSFSEDSDSRRKMHKIVKKQMAVPDYTERLISKESVLNVLQNILNKGADNGADRKMADGVDGAVYNIPSGNAPESGAGSDVDKILNDNGQMQNGENSFDLSEANNENIKPQAEVMEMIMRRIKDFAMAAEKFIPEKELLFGKKDSAENEKTSEEKAKDVQVFRLPDQNDIHCYYECEALPYGCMKLKHKQCPRGQFFSLKQMRCLKMYYWRTLRRKKSALSAVNSKKLDLPDPNPDDSEPSNEWLDATQGGATQKIPSEFKPKRKPTLKIYHLRVKRKLKELLLRMKAKRKRHVLNNIGSASTLSQRRLARMPKGVTKRHGSTRRHHPRSFLIRINKKEGKHNQESITENDENDSDGDSEEGDEEEDEDEDAEEDQEESEEDENVEEGEDKAPPKMSRKDSIKEFFRSAKAAVTNRAKFTEPSMPSTITSDKDGPAFKTNKSDYPSDKSKQVLLDANIKVDSAFGSALKNMLRNKQKDTQPMLGTEGLISDRGSQDQMDPELLRVYQHLIRNNPRVKRFFLAKCPEKKN